MTTPTREDVVKMAEQAGFSSCNESLMQDGEDLVAIYKLEELVGVARADLEATITKQADELKKLRTENELLKQVETNLCELHNVALAELESLRKDYNELLFAVGHKYQSESRHQTALRYIRRAEEPCVIATAPKQEK